MERSGRGRKRVDWRLETGTERARMETRGRARGRQIEEEAGAEVEGQWLRGREM